jgi:hypothetical protein
MGSDFVPELASHHESLEFHVPHRTPACSSRLSGWTKDAELRRKFEGEIEFIMTSDVVVCM